MTTEREQILALAGEPVAKVVIQDGYWSGYHYCDREQADLRWMVSCDKQLTFKHNTLLYTADQVLAATKPLTEEIAILQSNQANVEATHKLTLREVQRETMRLQTEADNLRQQLAEQQKLYLDASSQWNAYEDELRQQLADMTQDRDVWMLKAKTRPGRVADSVPVEQLAAAQADNERLREVLEDYVNNSNEHDCGGGDVVVATCESREKAVKAIASPTDTSALEAMIAKAGEVTQIRAENTATRNGQRRTAEAIRALPGVKLEDLR
jgi:hypothetical protein